MASLAWARGALLRAACQHVGAGAGQEASALIQAAVGAQLQRGEATPVSDIYPNAMRHQALGNRTPVRPLHRKPTQEMQRRSGGANGCRRTVEMVDIVRVGAMLEQLLDHGRIGAFHGNRQRRYAALTRAQRAAQDIRVGALAQQFPDVRCIAMLDGGNQVVVVLGHDVDWPVTKHGFKVGPCSVALTNPCRARTQCAAGKVMKGCAPDPTAVVGSCPFHLAIASRSFSTRRSSSNSGVTSMR
jgi:hypothetical protein